jgi:hypothetical protein
MRITGTLHDPECIIIAVPHLILLKMRNVSDKICTENQNTNFILNNFSLFVFENRTVYEIMWKKTVERGRTQMAIWRMSIA